MANLNLSQFTEKTFVADADWTFVWDTAGAISKKVSRNNWLNSGTITTDAPVTISQTWNDVAQTFKALVVNAAGTSDANSASGSLLLDLQLNGVSQVSVKKSGQTVISSLGSAAAPSFIIGTNCGFYQPTNTVLNFSSLGENVLRMYSLGLVLGAKYLGFGASITTEDTILLRDGAPNTLALRNGINPQTFNVYGTSSSSNTVYERMFTKYNGTALAFQVGTQHVGATARPLQLLTDNAARMTIGTTGNVGIGTTAPAEKLHVLGGKVLFGDPADATGTAGNGELTLQARSFPQLNLVSNIGGSGFSGINIKVGTSDKAGLIVNTGTGEVKMGGLGTGGYFTTVYSNAVERIRVDAAGNVGIGTTAPAAKLTIITPFNNYPTNTNPVLSLRQSTDNTFGFDWIQDGQNTGDLHLHRVNNSASNHVLTITRGGGNVGIGTTAPSSKLEVYLNPANNYTTEKVQFGNSFFGNGVSGYSFMWMGGISTPLTLSNSNYVLASDGSGTILNSPSTSGITFQVGGSNRWSINTSGHFLAATDNTYDIGASGANRPRNVYVGTSLFTGVGGINFDINARLRSPATDVITLYNNGLSDFNRLQFGGTTSSFPSLKRSSTTLQARLADDSAFAPIQGKLTTDTAFTSGAITDTGYIVLYDSTGAAYKVACTPV